MTHRHRGIMLSVALISHCVPAANAQTVQEMLPACTAATTMDRYTDHGTTEIEVGFCLGLMLGTMQLMSFNCSAIESGFSTPPLLRAEMPPTSAAAAQAFVTWAKENPQAWGDVFVSGAINALREAFPCPN